jgi:heme exporter protein B
MRAKFLRIISILSKDMVCEFRSKQGIAIMILPGILTAGLFKISGISTAEPKNLAACILMVTLLFAGILGGQRTAMAEYNNGCINGLLACPAESGEIYFAKSTFIFLLLTFSGLILVPVLSVLFLTETHILFPKLLFSILLLNIALAGIITILAFLLCGSSSGNSLLSIIFIPVMLPVFIPAVELITCSMTGGDIMGVWSKSAGFLVCFDVIFVTLGWLLFDFVLEPE